MGTAMKHCVTDRVKPSFVIFDQMSKLTNEGLTRSGTQCLIAVPIWQQWASKVNIS